MSLTVAGIGTEVGKTVVSAMLCEALSLDYWKPIQAGNLDNTDSDTVRSLSPSTRVWPERHRLREAISPHAAAKLDSTEIELNDFECPTGSGLLVELAGGLLVPLNSLQTTKDLALRLGFPVVLVANYYLGSINHTLMSIEVLKRSGLQLVGVVFNGRTNYESRAVILEMSEIELLVDVSQASPLTPEFVRNYADELREHPRLASL